jgi:hypothetical protein
MTSAPGHLAIEVTLSEVGPTVAAHGFEFGPCVGERRLHLLSLVAPAVLRLDQTIVPLLLLAQCCDCLGQSVAQCRALSGGGGSGSAPCAGGQVQKASPASRTALVSP